MNTNEFAIEQLETRLEMHCGFHWGWCRVRVVCIPFTGYCIYVWRPCLRWYCH